MSAQNDRLQAKLEVCDADSGNVYEAGIQLVGLDHHGKAQLRLTINEHTGDAFISREMWQAIGDAAWPRND